MSDFKIYNGFGITPSKNYVAAGYDFHIPYLKDESKVDMMLDALKKSYKLDDESMETVVNSINLHLSAIFDKEFSVCDIVNITHLFLALTPPEEDEDEYDVIDAAIDDFISYRLTFDDNGVPGMVVYEADYLLFNSGIKVNLPHDSAGIFFNKSGKGNQGFDVRACVVDEDYSGYVHLSSEFDKVLVDGQTLYCGDKFSQMVILPVIKTTISELTEEEYNKAMENSMRGADGFGSSDVKH